MKKGSSYNEINGERQWFDETKTHTCVVTHFYRPSTRLCEILDKHLIKLANKYTTTRFIKINAEKCFFLVNRLNITVMPTIIMTKNNSVIDKQIGFTELGDTENFTTKTLEYRLSKYGIIPYKPLNNSLLRKTNGRRINEDNRIKPREEHELNWEDDDNIDNTQDYDNSNIIIDNNRETNISSIYKELLIKTLDENDRILIRKYIGSNIFDPILDDYLMHFDIIRGAPLWDS